MKKIASYALGCKVNQYESEAIAELFAEKGYEVVSVDDKADVYIINTCTVTNFGDKKSRQLIRKVKRQNENAIVAVVGCYAQTAPEELAAVHGVNLVIGTKDKSKIVELVEDYQAEQGVQNYVTDIMHERVFEPLEIKKLANRTRAYLKIQDGCSQFCSYCIIPYARGPIRSRQPEDVIAEVKRLAEIIEQYQVDTIVLGYPKNLDNSEGERCEKTKVFEAKIKGRFPKIPVVLWDERFSTIAAERALRMADLSHDKRKSVIDKMAAVHILQGYLDSKQ